MRIILPIAFILISGTTLYARGSVPGNILYPVKVHLNENVHSVFSMTDKSEAVAEISHAVKRLEEAEKLIVSGQMTEVEMMNLERSFQLRMNVARGRIDKLREEGKFTEASDLELHTQNTMAAHRSILLQISHNTDVDISKIMSNVENEQNVSTYKLENIQGRALAGTDLRNVVESKMKAAVDRIDEARKLQLNKTGGLSNNIQIETKSSLSAAENLFEQGQEEYDMGSYGNALVLFQNAAHVAHSAEVLITNANTLKLSKSGTTASLKTTIAAE